MATLSELRDAITARLETISGLHVYSYWAEQVVVPATRMKRQAGPSPAGMGRLAQVTFRLTVLVQCPDLERAQEAMDPYVNLNGASSIVGALLLDPDLGGVARGITVEPWGPDQTVMVGSEYGSATLDVTVRYVPSMA